jgi:hypothetical protein
MELLQNPEYYRERARELRLVAANCVAAVNRDTLLLFAEDFDFFADQASGFDGSGRFRNGC